MPYRTWMLVYVIINYRSSHIKVISACYLWAARDSSMSLAYVGTSGSEVAVLVSFSIFVSKLYKGIKWPV
jgi:hypothetical protein